MAPCVHWETCLWGDLGFCAGLFFGSCTDCSPFLGLTLVGCYNKIAGLELCCFWDLSGNLRLGFSMVSLLLEPLVLVISPMAFPWCMCIKTQRERQRLKSKFHISCSFYMTINSNMKAKPSRPHLNLNVPKGWGTCAPPSSTITLGTKAPSHKENGDKRQLPVR